jgi:hypothetical protein
LTQKGAWNNQKTCYLKNIVWSDLWWIERKRAEKFSTTPTSTHSIQYPRIGLLGQSNPPFFNTWYQKIDTIQYIGQYCIGLDQFHHCSHQPVKSGPWLVPWWAASSIFKPVHRRCTGIQPVFLSTGFSINPCQNLSKDLWWHLMATLKFLGLHTPYP